MILVGLPVIGMEEVIDSDIAIIKKVDSDIAIIKK